MSALVIGVDASTTACKALAFDAAGNVVAEGRCAITLHNPEPDGWEQDAEDWWAALEHALSSLTSALGARAGDVRALAIANQRETFVLTDPSGRPLHPALVWMDARCRPEVTEAVAEIGEAKLLAVTGKPPCVTPSFFKARYLLRRKSPALGSRELRLLDVHAFLVWRLTGELATALPAADPLGLVDIVRGDWSDELLAALSLTRAQVPRLVAAGEAIGTLRADVAKRVGLPSHVTVVGGAGDGQAAGLGAGITSADRAYLNLGTAIVSGVASDTPRINRAFRTLCGALSGTYFLETDLKGGIFSVGWLLEKLLRKSGRSDEVILAELEREAARLAPGAGGLIFVPYMNGVMNPYWDDDATGMFLGLRGDHGAAHLYRAIMEGIAFEQRLHSRAVEQATGVTIDELVVMGGAAKSDFVGQLVADVLGRALVRGRTAEATALGAAMLAAPAAALHTDVRAAARAMTGTAERFAPSEARHRYDQLFEGVYAGLYPSVRGAMTRLRALAD